MSTPAAGTLAAVVLDNTPVVTYPVRGVEVFVKREDLCCPLPGPPFSKIRGVLAHIRARPEPVIGVLDTFHSMAGWAVSYICQSLGKQAIDYWPRYKRETGAPRSHQQEAAAMGAQLVALPAGMSAVLHHIAAKDLRVRFGPSGYLMPNALQLTESVRATADELVRTVEAGAIPSDGTMLISVSSGTIAAGVLMGLDRLDLLKEYTVILHMGYSRPIEARFDYITHAAGLFFSGLAIHQIEMIDEGYAYADFATGSAPFPCNPYYDLKAWRWLEANITALRGPITFWSIGA